MTQLPLVLALFAGGLAAGVVAALLGIGGGVLIVPLLTLVFRVPLRTALGASLVSAILASDGAALWPGKRQRMEVPLAWGLALASTFGATLGATLALNLNPDIIQGVFAIVLLYAAFQLATSKGEPAAEGPANGSTGPVGRVRRVAMGLVALVAGAGSGLLGIGGGIIIVPALHLILRKPFKTATATSNLLIGLTALIGAFTYWSSDALPLVPVLPIAAGAFAGALIGSALDRRISSRVLRWGMAGLLAYSALQLGSILLSRLLALGGT